MASSFLLNSNWHKEWDWGATEVQQEPGEVEAPSQERAVGKGSSRMHAASRTLKHAFWRAMLLSWRFVQSMFEVNNNLAHGRTWVQYPPCECLRRTWRAKVSKWYWASYCRPVVCLSIKQLQLWPKVQKNLRLPFHFSWCILKGKIKNVLWLLDELECIVKI